MISLGNEFSLVGLGQTQPEPEPDQEIYSFSKLSAHDTCPRMWQLTYLDKAPRKENAFSAFGTLVHSILERYAKHDLPLCALADIYEWEWPLAFSGVAWPPNKYVSLEERYKEQGLTFFKEFRGLPGSAEILGVEKHFEKHFGDFLFQGIADLVYRDAGKLKILDWKTAKPYTKSDQAQKRRQLYLYASWMKDEFGSFPDELIFYHIRDQRKVTTKFQEKDLSEAILWATKKVHELRTAWYFPPTPSDFFCKYICSVRGECEHGGKYL